MVKFILLIQEIGFVNIKSDITEFIRYNFDDYYITIVTNNNVWSMSKSSSRSKYSTGPWIKFDGVYGFEFNEIDLLKEHFISYFRDIKIKELGI
jgi:hypothetical protein